MLHDIDAWQRSVEWAQLSFSSLVWESPMRPWFRARGVSDGGGGWGVLLDGGGVINLDLSHLALLLGAGRRSIH